MKELQNFRADSDIVSGAHEADPFAFFSAEAIYFSSQAEKSERKEKGSESNLYKSRFSRHHPEDSPNPDVDPLLI
jgi:hypothetical protein